MIQHVLQTRQQLRHRVGAAAEGGPGPLVTHFSAIAGTLPCPLFVVPGGLNEEQIDAVS